MKPKIYGRTQPRFSSLGERIVRRKKRFPEKLSAEEKARVGEQEHSATEYHWVTIKREPLDADTLADVEAWHRVKFKPLLKRLRRRFPNERIKVLDEGAGRSTLKEELMQPEFGGNLHITATDVRQSLNPDRVANVMDLVKEFGNNRFHLVVSTVGGVVYTPFPERALRQLVSVLKPKGIGIVSVGRIPRTRVVQFARNLGIKIWQCHADSIVFTKLSERK